MLSNVSPVYSVCVERDATGLRSPAWVPLIPSIGEAEAGGAVIGFPVSSQLSRTANAQMSHDASSLPNACVRPCSSGASIASYGLSSTRWSVLGSVGLIGGEEAFSDNGPSGGRMGGAQQ